MQIQPMVTFLENLANESIEGMRAELPGDPELLGIMTAFDLNELTGANEE